MISKWEGLEESAIAVPLSFNVQLLKLYINKSVGCSMQICLAVGPRKNLVRYTQGIHPNVWPTTLHRAGVIIYKGYLRTTKPPRAHLKLGACLVGLGPPTKLNCESNRKLRKLQHVSKAKLVGNINAT